MPNGARATRVALALLLGATFSVVVEPVTTSEPADEPRCGPEARAMRSAAELGS